MAYRVGVDVGGTFTDFCAFDERTTTAVIHGYVQPRVAHCLDSLVPRGGRHAEPRRHAVAVVRVRSLRAGAA